MLRNYAVHLFLIAGVAAALAIGSTFTPVISRSGNTDMTSAEVKNAKQEYSYCRANLDDVNCACFAGISGHILSQQEPDFRGDFAVDRSDLVRAQGMQSC